MIEIPKFSNQSWHKARTAHVCSECHRTISPGEEYGRIFGIWSGRAKTFKFCDVCQWVRKLLDLHPMDDVYGELWENVKSIEDIEPRMVRVKLLKDAGWSWKKLEQYSGFSHVTLRIWVKQVEFFEERMKRK